MLSESCVVFLQYPQQSYKLNHSFSVKEEHERQISFSELVYSKVK